ncbi:hypothetical protein PAXRUDRAFT_440962 [Paxillus rubicundulus Ve08.2h10]|uniref:Uncharacterized protein n=1 Tax=Paxillus rubicundulus Ve08.2h10 TaxID=930991 RepID=A0A0D0DQD5_9AGAM|nr:hypothetical protein PAXRUDRAFT_440962 [Paxillus rubicundulus Ve08.2h10]
MLVVVGRRGGGAGSVRNGILPHRKRWQPNVLPIQVVDSDDSRSKLRSSCTPNVVLRVLCPVQTCKDLPDSSASHSPALSPLLFYQSHRLLVLALFAVALLSFLFGRATFASGSIY